MKHGQARLYVFGLIQENTRRWERVKDFLINQKHYRLILTLATYTEPSQRTKV